MTSAKKLKGKHRRQFVSQIDICCTLDGQMRTMHDDLVQATGESKPGRQSLLRKLELEDEDGDPVFFFPGTELPERCQMGDAGVCVDEQTGKAVQVGVQQGHRVRPYAHFASDPSRNPDFDTLHDKWLAARARRLEEMGEAKTTYRAVGPSLPLPAKAEAAGIAITKESAAATDAKVAASTAGAQPPKKDKKDKKDD